MPRSGGVRACMCVGNACVAASSRATTRRTEPRSCDATQSGPDKRHRSAWGGEVWATAGPVRSQLIDRLGFGSKHAARFQMCERLLCYVRCGGIGSVLETVSTDSIRSRWRGAPLRRRLGQPRLDAAVCSTAGLIPDDPGLPDPLFRGGRVSRGGRGNWKRFRAGPSNTRLPTGDCWEECARMTSGGAACVQRCARCTLACCAAKLFLFR
eukprot:351373-Chlamydomonas_euryale.AAC.5